jgi:hypothetical protein
MKVLINFGLQLQIDLAFDGQRQMQLLLAPSQYRWQC